MARIFLNLTDEQAQELAISENLQRDDLSDYEKTMLCLRLQKQGKKIEEITALMNIGKKGDKQIQARTVKNYLLIAKTMDEIKDALKDGKISLSMALLLAEFAKKKESENVFTRLKTLEIVEKISDEEISIREVRQYLESLLERKEKKERAPFLPIRLKEKKGGGFDLTVKFRPQRTMDVEAIIRQLKGIIEKLESKSDERK